MDRVGNPQRTVRVYSSMGSVEYSFGTGDGATSTWTSEADLDLGGHGHPDAVRLDFDGDGAADDAMWDSDGDGTADTSVLDVGDPSADRFFTDPSHLGVWNREVGFDFDFGGDQMRWSESGIEAPDIRQAEPVAIRQPDLSVDSRSDGAIRWFDT